MPQTKEEIIKQYSFFSNSFTDKAISMSTLVYQQDALKAMDEYAEQKAIEFAFWASKNGWRINAFDNTDWKWTNLNRDPSTLSSADLYKLFIESTSAQTEQ